MMLPLANSSVECHLFLYIIRIWGYPANIPPSSLLGLKSLVKFKFLIYTESARNLLFRLFRAGKNPYFFGTLSSIQYQDVLGKSVGTKWLKIPWVAIPVPVRFRPAASDKVLETLVVQGFWGFFALLWGNDGANLQKGIRENADKTESWNSIGNFEEI